MGQCSYLQWISFFGSGKVWDCPWRWRSFGDAWCYHRFSIYGFKVITEILMEKKSSKSGFGKRFSLFHPYGLRHQKNLSTYLCTWFLVDGYAINWSRFGENSCSGPVGTWKWYMKWGVLILFSYLLKLVQSFFFVVVYVDCWFTVLLVLFCTFPSKSNENCVSDKYIYNMSTTCMHTTFVPIL